MSLVSTPPVTILNEVTAEFWIESVSTQPLHGRPGSPGGPCNNTGV